MALQTQDLVMVGLGIQGDRPLNRLQPPLVDGIHLRWSFKQELGFPWYGFYLFRRFRLLGDPVCLSRETLHLSVASILDVQLHTPVGRVSSDAILRLTDDFPTTSAGGQVEFDLDGRQYLRFTLPPGELARRVEVHIGFRQTGTIQVTAFSGNRPAWRQVEVPVIQSEVKGRARETVPAVLEFDAISAVQLSSGPAALIELCYVPVSQDAVPVPLAPDAPRGWEPVPDFPNPMRLPLEQIDYPSTPGQPEDLTRARTTARRRIRYGDPNRLTAPAAPTPTTGTVSVVNGSALVEGAGTRWGPDLAGQLFQANGDPTAYTILTVVNANKLILSRGYGGATRNGAAYTVGQDAFGQLHDYLVHLVAGGSAAGPMTHRSVPAPIYDTGIIEVNRNSPVVRGTGTNWDRGLTGLGLHIVGDATGMVIVHENSDRVTGVGTNWSVDIAGLAFRVAGEGRVYTIMSVDVPAQQLRLDRGYLGSSDTSKNYTTFEKTVYTIASVDSPTQITLDRPYMGNSGPGKSYAVVARLQPVEPGGGAPRMPRQHPLDLILTMALHPAVAQMVGLYWVDQTADPNFSYDYLIVADYTGVGGLDPNTVLAHLQQDGFNQLNGYILFNRQVQPAAQLATDAPGGLQAHPLPAASLAGSASNAQNVVGLSWDLGMTEQGVLLPGKPVMYHVWRDDLGNGEAPAAEGPRTLVTRDGPLLVTRPGLRPGEASQRPPDWPTTPLYFIDSRLRDGWYGYRVSGIDIFGRFSPESAPATVRLLDDTPPPPPTGIEAFALDPDDPTVLQDAAYHTWRAANPGVVGLRVRWRWTHMHRRQAPDVREFRIYYQPGRLNAFVGRTLNISAASAAESTVQTDIPNNRRLNAYVGGRLRIGSDAFRIVASDAATPLRLRVRNIGPADTVRPRANASCTVAIPPPYRSGSVRLVNGSPTVTGTGTGWHAGWEGSLFQVSGEQATYTVVRVDGKNQLTLNRGYQGRNAAPDAYVLTHPLFIDFSQPTNWAQRYHVVGYDEQVIEQVPAVSAPDGSALSGAAATVAGMLVALDGNLDLSGAGLVGEFLYLANDTKRSDKTYLIRALDNAAKVVSVDEAPDIGNAPSPWVIGRPVRLYEVFLPAPGDFVPSLAETIVYAHIGVSAADDKDYTADDPVWADAGRGGWGDRPGNEGRVGPAAQIFRVRRTPPPIPEVPVYTTDRVYATPADYHSRSFYTYRWQPLVDPQTQEVLPVKCHVFRALDDAVFKRDWSQRPRPQPLSPADLERYPVEWRADNPENNQRRQDIANALNQLNNLSRDAAMAHYRNLPDDALRVLAGLPGNERAFTQLTIQPLDPQEPDPEDPTLLRWRNQRGPDDPDNFQVPDPNHPLAAETLRVYIDTLDGRSSNRYFYRAAYVDGGHNRSMQLSLASPPVHLPDVVPPRTPVITKVLGGDRQITLHWASNRESDLAEYRVYRADSSEAARDLRLMGQPVDIVAADSDPAARPAEVTWTNQPLPGLTTYCYRLVAVDNSGSPSVPSPVVSGRAYQSPPEPPAWNPPQRQPVSNPTHVFLSWTHPTDQLLACLVERRAPGVRRWVSVSGWMPHGLYSFEDTPPDLAAAWEYRLRVRDQLGQVAEVMPTVILLVRS